MAYSPKQWRAINHWLKTNGLVVQLSAFPILLRALNTSGEIEEMHISSLEDQYNGWLEQEKRRKAQERREAKKNEKVKK